MKTRRRRRLVKILVILFLLSLPLVGGVFSWMAYRGEVREVTRLPAVPYEALSTAAADGLAVEGWLLGSGQCGAVVVVPGWGQGRGTQLASAEELAKAGYRVALYDPRGGTGRSTYGTRESSDVRAVLEWLELRGISAGRVVLLGHSMGGSAVQLTAANRSLAGLILESSVYDIQDTRRQVVREYRLIFPAAYAAVAALYDRYVWGVKTPDLERAREQIMMPVLMLHTAEDEKARLTTAVAAQRQLAHAQLTILSGNHRAFLDDESARQQSARLIKDFLQQQLGDCTSTLKEGDQPS